VVVALGVGTERELGLPTSWPMTMPIATRSETLSPNPEHAVGIAQDEVSRRRASARVKSSRVTTPVTWPPSTVGTMSTR